jgi:hypothetical protein
MEFAKTVDTKDKHQDMNEMFSKFMQNGELALPVNNDVDLNAVLRDDVNQLPPRQDTVDREGTKGNVDVDLNDATPNSKHRFNPNPPASAYQGIENKYLNNFDAVSGSENQSISRAGNMMVEFKGELDNPYLMEENAKAKSKKKKKKANWKGITEMALQNMDALVQELNRPTPKEISVKNSPRASSPPLSPNDQKVVDKFNKIKSNNVETANPDLHQPV